MAIIVPNTGSTYAAAASVPNSANRWAWLGFVSAPNSSGCVVWYTCTASDNGSPLMPMVSACGRTPGMVGPFNSPCGFFAASVNGGCAVIWLKEAS